MITIEGLLKSIYSSKRRFGVTLGAFEAILMFVIMIVLTHDVFLSAVTSLIFAVGFSVFFSYFFWKSYAYFIKNIKQNKISTMRTYAKLYKTSSIPDDRGIYGDYTDYLKGVEKLQTTTKRISLFSGIVCSGIFLLSVVFGADIYSTVFFAAAAVLNIIARVIAVHSLKKIAYILKRMS